MAEKFLDELLRTIKQKPDTKNRTHSAIVSKVDNEGTVWVYIAGSDIETPTASAAAEVKSGDEVNVEWRNNRLFIAGNYSNPSAGTYRVANVENAAATANNLAEQASRSAVVAQDAAERAVQDAATAHEAADAAQTSATSAYNSANNALTQLSVVEDVAGTLNWISEHGSFELTEDTTVQAGTVYFIYQGGDYVPIAQPDPTANPSEEGWYILDVTDSQASYIMSHLAVTNAGLWVLPVDRNVQYDLADSDGNLLVDSDGNQIITYSPEPSNAPGYKLLLSNNGMSIYNDQGAVVANYGTTTTIGATSGYNTHIDSNGFYVRNGTTVLAQYGSSIKFYETTNHTVAAEVGASGLVIKKGSIQIGSKTSASDVTNSGTYIDASGNMATSNIKAHGGTIGGFTLSATQLNAYGTASGAGTSSNGLYRLLIQSNPGTNGGNIAFGAASRATTSDSWTWNTYINHNGYLYAKNANIQGTITSSNGTIGGWTINSSTLSRANGSYTTSLRSTGLYFEYGNSYTNYYAQGFDINTPTWHGFLIDSSFIIDDSKGTVDLSTTSGANFYSKNSSCTVQVGSTGATAQFVSETNGTIGLKRVASYIIYGTSSATYINGSNVYLRDSTNGRTLLFYTADNSNTLFRPTTNGVVYLGSSSYRWNTIFTNGAVNTGSDLKIKDVIEDHDWKVDEFIKGLKPIAYRLKDNTSGRIHMGFGAQDVAKLSKDLDIGDLSVYEADIVKEDGEIESYHGEEIDDSKLTWGLKYSEFIAPMVLEIQRLMSRVDELEAIING